jgi:uncharacterized DUF497 family protein
VNFSWDSKKAKLNKRKHGISFNEAEWVFRDENALMLADPDHSDDEERFIMIGLGEKLNMLVVCFCERHKGSEIRIISARKANRGEEKQYMERL